MDKSTLQIVLSAKDEISAHIKNVNSQLSKFSDEMVRAKTTGTEATKGITKGVKKLGNATETARIEASKLAGVFGGLATMRLVRSLGALYLLKVAADGFKSAGIAAMAFQKQMSDINTLFSDSGQKIAKLSAGVEQLTQTMGVSPEDLGSAAYDIVSAGITNTSKALKTLKASGELAVAGLSTTKQATNILTSALNTFNKSGLDAHQMANILFKTVKFGKTTISALSQSFGATATTAEQVGVSLQDLSAATAALTLVGLPASQAQTALAGAMTAFLKPTTQMKTVLADLGVKQKNLGNALPVLINKYKNFGGVLKAVVAETKKQGLLLGNVVGRKEALNAVLALTNQVSAKYNVILGSMNDKTDVLTKAFKKQEKTMTEQWQLIKNKLWKVMVDLGNIVFPLVIKAINSMISVVKSAGEFYNKYKGIILGVAGAVDTLLIALALYMIAIKSIATYTAFTTALRLQQALIIALATEDVPALTGAMVALKGATIIFMAGMGPWIVLLVAFSVVVGVIVNAIYKLNKAYASLAESQKIEQSAISESLKIAAKDELAAHATSNAKLKQYFQDRADIIKNNKKILATVTIKAKNFMSDDVTKHVLSKKERESLRAQSQAKLKEMTTLYKQINSDPALKKQRTFLENQFLYTGSNKTIEPIKIGNVGITKSMTKELAKAKKSFMSFGTVASIAMIKLNNSNSSNIGKVVTKLKDLSRQYETTQSDGTKAVARLQLESSKRLATISDSITRVDKSITKLKTNLESTQKSNISGLAAAFANTTQKIKALKYQLARSKTAQSILDIKSKLKVQQDALAKNVEIRKKYASQISSAEKYASGTDLQRAITDFHKKQKLATTQYNTQLIQLQAQKSALIEKQNLEISTTAKAIALSKEETKSKLNDLVVKEIALAKDFVSQEKLYNEKVAKINKIVKDGELYRAKVTASTVSKNKAQIQTEINKYNSLATAIRNASSVRSASLLSVIPFQGFSKGSFDVGGPIRQSGLYNLHQGEYVMNQRQSRSSGGVSVNINGGVYLSHTVAEQIGDMIISRLKTNMRI